MREEVQLDPQRQKQARRYARLRRRLWALEVSLAGLYLGLWAFAGWAHLAAQALRPSDQSGALPFSPPWWVRLLLMGALLGLPWSLLTFPLDFYRSYTLPHRFGLSTQSLADWALDQAKGLLISLTLGIPLLLGLYALIRAAPDHWWLWAAALYTLFTAVLAALAPILLMPIFFRFRPLGEDHADLAQRLMRMAERAGARVQGVFTFDMSRRTRAANAALTGLGRTRRIILGDTLLESFTPDEIETVLAHELAHHVHRDIPLMILAQGAFNLLGFSLAGGGLALLASRTGLTGPADPAGLPLLILLLALAGLISMPLANAFSRWRERLADDYALAITGKPQAFASAMTRLANQNLAQVDPEDWVVLLFYSHPPLSQRIHKAQAWAGHRSKG